MKKVALVSALCLVMVTASGAAGASARKPKSKPCPKFVPVEPDTQSAQRGEALEAEVTPLTDAATEENPLVFEFSHGPGLRITTDEPPPVDDSVFLNFQLLSKAPDAIVSVRLEWGTPLSDIDLHLFDASGALLNESISFNYYSGTPADTSPDDDSQTVEQLLDTYLARCSGFTIQSAISSGPGESVTAKLWLTQPE